MRVLIISDIHANLTALEAVLEDAGDFDATWCLGDVLGYGPDPDDCVSMIRSLPNLTCLLGKSQFGRSRKYRYQFFQPGSAYLRSVDAIGDHQRQPGFPEKLAR